MLSSLKLYRPAIRVGEAIGRATVLGAVFTPAARRGRGHARAAIEAALEAARARRDLAALLFTDIGTAFYRALGFVALPAFDHAGRLPRASSADRSLLFVEPTDADRPAIAAAHEASGHRRSLRLLRDDAHWRFIELRARRFFERLGDPSVRQRWTVAREPDGRFVGYLATVESGGDWVVREVGAADGSAATEARLLDAAAAAARADGRRDGSGWLAPDTVRALERWRPRPRSRDRAVPMLLPLVDGARPTIADESAFVPFHDQF